MEFQFARNIQIGGSLAYLVLESNIGEHQLITVVHKNDFKNKLGGTRFVRHGTAEEAFYLAKGMSEKCLAFPVPN